MKVNLFTRSEYISVMSLNTALFCSGRGQLPLLVEDWGAIEEVLLLDAVEQDGFGNWCGWVA